jgi:hypothetical protein
VSNSTVRTRKSSAKVRGPERLHIDLTETGRVLGISIARLNGTQIEYTRADLSPLPESVMKAVLAHQRGDTEPDEGMYRIAKAVMVLFPPKTRKARR